MHVRADPCNWQCCRAHPSSSDSPVDRTGGRSADRRLAVREAERDAVWGSGASLCGLVGGLVDVGCCHAAKSSFLQNLALVVVLRAGVQQVGDV